MSGLPTRDELDLAIALAGAIDAESRGEGPLVTTTQGRTTVISVSTGPQRFTRAIRIKRDDHEIFETPSGYIVRLLLRSVRAIERSRCWPFDVRVLSPERGESEQEWIDRCAGIVRTWRLRNLARPSN